ncbi:hypothetical protein MBLNU457_3232t1 [Dothideomycetes sp. NU457]
MPLAYRHGRSYRLGRSSILSSVSISVGNYADQARKLSFYRQCWPVKLTYLRLKDFRSSVRGWIHPDTSPVPSSSWSIRQYNAQAVALPDEEHEDQVPFNDTTIGHRAAGATLVEDDFFDEALPLPSTKVFDERRTPDAQQEASGSGGLRRSTRSLNEALRFAAEQDVGPPVGYYSGNDPYTRFMDRPRRANDRQMLKIKNLVGPATASPGQSKVLAVVTGCIKRMTRQIKDPRLHRGDPPLAWQPAMVDLDQAELRVLDREGFPPPVVRLWVAALLSRDSTNAAHLFADAVQLAKSQSIDTPSVLILAVLRRRNMTAAAFRSFFSSSVDATDCDKPDVTTPKHSSLTEQDDYPSSVTQYESFLLRRWLRLYKLFQGLMIHALRVQPDALEYIASLWVKCMSRFPIKDSENVPLNAILTLFHNRFLFCLSGPAALEPMKTSYNQINAQGHVLQHMVYLSPPLNLNREGYRGVLRVQLARPKTSTEKVWASLKSEAWPPWKEDRTGMDALIGPEHGISQAGRIVHRLQEAGFPLTSWENAAMVLAGWDTDGTPTIQTRTQLKGMRSLLEDPVIWAARIRSTGTRKEAWACFLAHEDSGYRPNEEIYLAMFEKVMAKEVRLAEERRANIRSFDPEDLPEEPDYASLNRPERSANLLQRGDVKEVFPGPRSAHQEIYTRTDLPDALQLLSHMESQGIKPTGRLLLYLMTNTPSWEIGWKVFETAVGGDVEDWLEPIRVFQKTALNLRTQELLSALIQLMIRFPSSVRAEEKLAGLQMRQLSLGDWGLDSKQPLALATNLLLLHRPYDVRAWDAYFSGLATISPGFSLLHRGRSGFTEALKMDGGREMLNEPINLLVAHRLAQHATQAMRERDIHVDKSIFRHRCTIVYRAAEVASDILDGDLLNGFSRHQNSAPVIKQIFREAEKLKADSAWIRDDFEHLVGISEKAFFESDKAQSDDTETSGESKVGEQEPSALAPRLNTVPPPTLLHAYVRALGAVHDFEGIARLFEFMKEYWTEIRTRKAEDRTGDEIFRRVMTAAKMYLQFGRDASRWVDMDDDELRAELKRCSITDQDHWAAPIEVVTRVHDVVKSMREEWGAWPKVYEMFVYIEKGKVKRRR